MEQDSENSRRPVEVAVIQVGALAIDLTAGWVMFNGERTNLTVNEYKFVECLARKPGSVIPTDELLGKVFGCAAGGTKAQLKNLVLRLRQKIEPDPDYPAYIVTARGRGYYMPTHVGDGTGSSATRIEV